MCGIYGHLVANYTTDDSIALRRSLNLLQHRGPDSSGIYEDEHTGLGLAHTRLSILDTSDLGSQPYHSQDNQAHLVFNGEIYNHVALRHFLNSSGITTSSNSDTEVLLCLYQYYRQESNPEVSIKALLPHLQGIFAFAIWDSQASTLLLARDPLGVKPLYYKASSTGIYFSSEMRTISFDDKEINTHSIHSHLQYFMNPTPETLLSSVHQLEPGSLLITDRSGSINKQKWYQNPLINTAKTTESKTQVNHTLQNLLRSAIHSQLTSDVPLGAFLSGGLDSSLICAIAKEKKKNLQCFTIAFTSDANDGFVGDLPYAEKVSSYLSLPLQTLVIDPDLFASSFSFLIWQLEAPLPDPAALCLYFISQAARKSDYKVLLSGAGGDDVFSGYRRHQSLKLHSHIRKLHPIASSILSSSSRLYSNDHPRARRIAKLFSQINKDTNEYIIHLFRWLSESRVFSLYSDDFKKLIVDSNYQCPLKRSLDVVDNLSPLSKCLFLEQQHFLPEHNLLYTDKLSMATGVEVRVPFLDNQLLKYAASIPDSLKLNHYNTKWILKQVAKDFLPKEIINRPKTGFGLPIRSWLKSELKYWLESILSPENLRRRGIFDPSAVKQLMDLNANGRIDASYTLLSVASIELWCQYFIDHADPPSNPLITSE